MKRFYKNTFIGRAFSNALRVVALLCVLLGVSTSAWGKTLSEYKNGSSSIYLIGGFNSWTTSDNNFKLNSSDGNLYTGSFEVNAGTYAFKIYTSDGKYYSSGTFSSGAQVEFNDSNGDMSLTATSNTGKVKLDVELYLEYGGQSKLTINQSAVAASTTYYLCGDFNSWNETSTPFSNGSCTLNLSSNTTYKFKIKDANNWYGNNGTITASVSGWTFKTSDGDCTIETSEISGSYVFTWHEDTKKLDVTYPTGSGSDDATADFSCENIEIWCKGISSYIDMHCYAWNPDNDSQKPLGDWHGSTRQGTGVYDGETYAVWSVTGYEKLNVIFNNGADTKTADIVGLTKGHRYIYELDDNWGGDNPIAQVIDCSGESQGEQLSGTIFMDLSSFTEWTKDGAFFKAVVTNTSSETTTYDMVQCASETNIYYIDQVLNLSEISKVTLQRINPADGTSVWNNTGAISFDQSLPCIKITGWNDSYTKTTYSGSCGVTTESIVYLSKDAVLSDDKSEVTMYGFLGYTFCANITEWGFVYTQCSGSTTNCIPTKNSARLKASSTGQLLRGESFELTTSGLTKGYTYGYKAYVMIEDFVYVSAETGYFTLADCSSRPVKGSPLTYTVNAALGEGYIDDCNLTYGSLETAIESLKNSYADENADYQYVTKNGDSYDLNQDVTFNVHFYDNTESTATAYTYKGSTKVASAGTDKLDGGKGLALLIDNINLTASAKHTLTITAANKVSKPWIHHPIIRNSRNITLDALFLVSDPAGEIKDNAFEIDINSQKWDAIGIGSLENANILVQNCMIGSSGFTGIHISGIDGVTFLDNTFEAVFTNGTANDINYGASAKFLACENVKFMRNDFRGDHATLVWMQECQKVLFMNNVFWNTNKWLATTQTPAAIRLVAQFGKDLQNLGFYYNTFYFANTDHESANESTSGYDFLAFSNTVNNSGGSSSDFITDKIDFMYNNCYSYDDDAPGKSSNPLLGRSASDFNFCPNNFWSQYDVNEGNEASAFDFTNCAEFINVKDNVCETTATGPASLVVKGADLNIGERPDISKTGFTLSENEMRRDRKRENARPENGSAEKWTLGAYQNSLGIETTTIIWQGVVSDKWDDRNNWIDAATGDRISCVNILSENLKVIIPQANSDIYITPDQGVAYWPQIPEDFADPASRRAQSKVKDTDLGIPANEQVSAGLGVQGITPSMYANTIELEYGAAIKGVENLKNGSEHYSNAIIGFDAPRSQWILVGTVVKPWDKELQEYRNIKSGDYFIENHLPHVYMHKAEIDGTNAKWAETFTDLTVEVEPTKVFAIQLPDQYGKYKLPAKYYNSMNGTNFDPTKAYSYSFDGRFVNDEAMPVYTGLTAGTPVLLNNSYPCNIDADKLEEISGGNVQYYDYNSGTFMNTDATTSQVLLKPQHGFIFTPASTSLSITPEMLVGGDTKSRSSKISLPTLSLNLFNANTGVGYSNVVVKIDELLEETDKSASDVEKVFTPNVDSPELYIIANDAMYSRYTINSNTKTIPLGVRLKKDMNIKFKKEYFSNYETAILVDTYTGKETDLLRNSYTTEALVSGDIEGRFFLNLGVASDVEDNGNTGGDVSTEVDENEISGSAINIFVDESNTIRVITNGVKLQTIYVSDMAGKTMKYDVKGYAVSLKLPVAQGVYTLNVIGDTANRTEKVILK